MTVVFWMAAMSVGSWLALTTIIGAEVGTELLLGMLGPLLVAGGSWVLVERTYRRNTTLVTSVMIAAFAAKLVFFGAYVALALSLPISPVPFVASLTGYFIALHTAEALCLRRLFAGDARGR